ncbi:MAG: MotA/TolQ/ExbB proton channel family protein, partial [Candidatus Diapherotrites archaeon]|nr:MotA/TolQ/ExbB proton channel family protein [Candidatus Diapherotrites archaeon]
ILVLQNMKLKPEKFAIMFEAAFQRNNGDRMKTVDELLPVVRKRGGVCGAIVEEIMVKYKDGVSKNLGPVDLRQWMTGGAESKAIVELPQLESHLSALAVISNVSTLMGLFGTVYGMIEAFNAMSKAVGGVKADEMAGGIAVALIATLGGLTVAIPSLILFNWIKGIISSWVVQVEETSSRVIDTLVG